MDAPKPVVESDITLNRVVDPDVKLKAHQYDHSKAFVLCWMWFADLAINNPEDPKADCSLSFAAEISSDFSQKIKERDYTAQSIENYYRQARMNAETANLSWDSMAVAMILVTLLTKLGSCDRFSGPLDLYVQKTPSLGSAARKLILDAEAQAKDKWDSLHECWGKIKREEVTFLPALGPKLLKVAHDTPRSPVTSTQKIQERPDDDFVNGDKEE